VICIFDVSLSARDDKMFCFFVTSESTEEFLGGGMRSHLFFHTFFLNKQTILPSGGAVDFVEKHGKFEVIQMLKGVSVKRM